MKTAKASLRYLRIAPRKVRTVANLIRGRAVAHAQAQLLVQPRRPATPLAKLLASAIANAEGLGMDMDKLYVASVRVDRGPMRKTLLPKARGRGTIVQKVASHVSLVIGEKEGLSAPLFAMPRRAKENKKAVERVERESQKGKEKPHEHADDRKVRGSTGSKQKLFSRKTGDA